MKYWNSLTKIDLTTKISFSSTFLELHLLLGKKQRKIYQVFQNSSLKRQRVKVGTYEKIINALLKWFTSMLGNNIPINSPILLQNKIESRWGCETIKTFNRLNLFTEDSGFESWPVLLIRDEEIKCGNRQIYLYDT